MPDAPQPDSLPHTSGDHSEASETDPQGSKRAGHAGGFTLDLSSGASPGQPEAWRRKRKQASPILTKIVDLTAPKPEPAPPKPSEQQAPKAQAKLQPKPPREKEREADRGRGKKPGGATLADLLDEETLARLRGEE